MPSQAKNLLFIPTYNCAAQLLRVLERVKSNCLDEVTEVLVVDNRSKDGTLSQAAEFRNAHKMTKLKLAQNNENYGLGGSHKVAFEYAIKNGFDNVIVLHGDDQGDASDIPLMLRLFDQDPQLDAVLGNRFSADSQVSGYSMTRILGNKALNLLFSGVMLKRIQDLGAGVNIYRVNRLKSIAFNRFSDYCDFNFYLLLATLEAGWKMKYSPIIWREEDQVSNTNALKMGFKALKALFGWKLRTSSVLIPEKQRSFEIQ